LEPDDRHTAAKTTSRAVKLDSKGCFASDLARPKAGVWKVRALWSGDKTSAAAINPGVSIAY